MRTSGYFREVREISAPGETRTGVKSCSSGAPPKIVSSFVAVAAAGYQMAVLKGRGPVPCQFLLFPSVKLRVTIPTLTCVWADKLPLLPAGVSPPEKHSKK